MVDNIKTTDSKGNEYDKFRISSDANAVTCANGTNKHFRGQPNVSIRTGKSIYGKEVVIQVQARDLISEYVANSGFDKHIEVYFTPEQALELFPPLLKRLGWKPPKEEDEQHKKQLCEYCGKGHLYCEECKHYTWSKDEN